MPIPGINFGAALGAALFAISCTPANSAPKSAEGAAPQTPAATASASSAAPAPDPVVAAADRGRVAGDSAAKTWIIIASDFQCPYCKEWHDVTYRAFIDTYVRSGKVKVAYINFPLGQHQNAVITAEGAMCASAQNKFWEYHDILFDSQRQWAPLADARPVLDSIARRVGVEMTAWSSCMNSKKMVPLIMADRDRAAAGGVASTPSFIVGNQVLAGALPLADMRAAIDEAIAKSGSAPKS